MMIVDREKIEAKLAEFIDVAINEYGLKKNK